MAFKQPPPPYTIDNTPVYRVDMEDNVMGKANNNGSIIINMDLHPDKVASVIAHEKVHLDQMERGDLDYDVHNVYWKGKTYSRATMAEGAKNLPWEAEAYRKS